MAVIRAVVFDFIGTLTKLVDYSLKDSKDKMFRSLVASGYNMDQESFFEAYNKADQKYREVRYGQLVEVANAVWVSEALNHLGYATTPQDTKIGVAVNVFFEDYISALWLRRSAKQTLQKLSRNFKLGIISNYTYAPVIYAGLRKLKINNFFNAVVVSEAVGWRKPNPKIFQEALKQLNVKADEVVYVGDTPLEDIEGAKNVGMKTVFIQSQFNSIGDMRKATQQPDHIIRNLHEVFGILKSSTSI